MHRNTLAFVIAAALGGFVAGFWLANSINRTAMTTPTQPLPANANTATGNRLSDAEIREKIAEADRNPQNVRFQSDLGVSLYRYAASEQDVGLLAESARILERANSLDPKDFEVVVALGNAHFDVGFYRKDAASFQKAREVYTKALELKPDDPDVTTDFGLTYFLQDPPDYDRAAAQLQKVGVKSPRHERSLQFLVQTYARQGKFADADLAIEKLRSINSSNPAIPELVSMVEKEKSQRK